MRPALVALSILFLGAAGFGAAQFLETRRLRDAWDQERADLQKQIDDLKRQAERANRFAGFDRSSSGPRPTRSADNSEPRPGFAASENPVSNFRRGNTESLREWMNSPEMQQLRALQQRSGLDFRYAGLFRSLQLNPQQLDRLKTLLAEKQNAMMDVVTSAQSEGPLNREDLRALINDAQSEIDSMIRAELGDRAYAQYENYEKTLPYRPVVDQLERRLSYSNAPLQPAQADQLAQILAETAPNRRTDGPMVMGAVNFGAVGGAGNVVTIAGAPVSTAVTSEAIARAQGILQPAQIEALMALQQEQLAMQQMQQQANEARMRTRNAQPTTPAGTAVVPSPPGRG